MTTTTKNAPGIRGNGPEGNDNNPTVQEGVRVMTTLPSTSRALQHHAPWCVQCEDVNGEWESHVGTARVVSLDGGGLPLRNAPARESLEVYAYRSDDGPVVIEVGTDEATSGCTGSMWLSVDEARRYAHAILAVVEEVGR